MKTSGNKGFLATLNPMGRSVPVKTPVNFTITNKINSFAHISYGTALICCSKCIHFYYQYIESNWALAVAKQGRDNIQFDMDEYLDNCNPNVVKAINAANQNVTQATQDVDAAKKAYDDCQSQK